MVHNAPGSDAVMSGDQFRRADAKRKLAICQEAGGRMAQVIGGTVKVRDDGDQVHVTGHCGGFPVRLVIWVAFASLKIEVKPLSELAVPSFLFRLRYDEDAAEHAGEELDRDEWDDNTKQKLYLSPHVFMEGKKDQLRQLKTLYDQLPPSLATLMLRLVELPNHGYSSITLHKDLIDVSLNSSDIPLSLGAAQRLAPILDFLTKLAQAAATSWRSAQATGDAGAQAAARVAARSVAPPQGPPPGAPAAPMPGTPVLVTWSDGHRYSIATAEPFCRRPRNRCSSRSRAGNSSG